MLAYPLIGVYQRKTPLSGTKMLAWSLTEEGVEVLGKEKGKHF